MAYVLDASAIVALARNEAIATTVVGDALENDKCYVAPATIATVYYVLLEKDGRSRADHWLRYMTSGLVVSIKPCDDKDTLRAVAHARMITRLPLCSRFAAALAKRLNCQVITADGNFEDLASAKFCKVKWIL